MGTEFAYGYKEKKGSGTERLNIVDGSFTPQRIFFGPWNDRWNFITENILIYSGTQYSPARYPAGPNAWADSIAIQGDGAITQDNTADNLIEYDRAIITVTYRSKITQTDDPDLSEEEKYKNGIYFEEELDTGIDYAQITKQAFISGDGSIIEPTRYFKIPLTTVDYQVVQPFVYTPNWLEIGSLGGFVNNICFIMPSGFVMPAGTALYLGPFGMTKVNVLNGGGINEGEEYPTPIWRLNHRISYNYRGHNVTINKDGKFVPITLTQSGFAPIPTSSLWPVFFGFAVGQSGPFPASTLTDIDFAWETIRELVDNNGVSYLDADVQTQMQSILSSVRSLGFRI